MESSLTSLSCLIDFSSLYLTVLAPTKLVVLDYQIKIKKTFNLPGDIPQKRDRDIGIDESQERLNNSKGNDVIPEVGPVANNVAQCPHGLLAHILQEKIKQALMSPPYYLSYRIQTSANNLNRCRYSKITLKLAIIRSLKQGRIRVNDLT